MQSPCPLYPHVWTYMDPARLQQVDGIIRAGKSAVRRPRSCTGHHGAAETDPRRAL
jgi:hypothetical protein